MNIGIHIYEHTLYLISTHQSYAAKIVSLDINIIVMS